MDNPYAIKRTIPSIATLTKFINILGNYEPGLVKIIKDNVKDFINSNYKWWWLDPKTGDLKLYQSFIIQMRLESAEDYIRNYCYGGGTGIAIEDSPFEKYEFFNYDCYHLYKQYYINDINNSGYDNIGNYNKLNNKPYRDVIRISKDETNNIKYPQIYFYNNLENKCFTMYKVGLDRYHQFNGTYVDNTPVEIKQDLTII